MGISDFNWGEIISYKSESLENGKQVVWFVKYFDGEKTNHATKLIEYQQGGNSIQGNWGTISEVDYNRGGGIEITV